jgi:hypothetical protein
MSCLQGGWFQDAVEAKACGQGGPTRRCGKGLAEMTALEAFANAAIGLIVSYAATYYVLG